MEINYQLLFNIVIGMLGTVMGVVIKTIWDAVQDLETKVHEDFVRRDDFKDAIKEIRQDINVIFTKIEATVTLIYKRLEGK